MMKGDCPTAALLQHQRLSVGPLRRERTRSVRPQCQEQLPYKHQRPSDPSCYGRTTVV